MRLFQCDICQKQVTEVYTVRITYWTNKTYALLDICHNCMNENIFNKTKVFWRIMDTKV